MAHPPEANPVPALQRGLALLRRLEADGPASLERLTRTSGLPKSSVRRLLRSLELCGAVRRDARTLRYAARLRLVELAEDAASLRDLAEPVLTDLAERTRQTVELYEPAWEAATLTMVQRVEPEQSIVTARARVGSQRPTTELDATLATLLVYLPRRRWPRQAWAWADGRQTALSRDAVADVVQRAGEQRVAVDLGINEHGVRRYAAPLCAGERLRGVLAVAQVCTPHDTKTRPDLADAVRAAAADLTRQLSPSNLISKESF